MRRNRLDQASMKKAVGCACLSLFFAVVGVALSLVKVVYGSEFIHACPSRDIIPVYIVVSGCLAVLFSALKQEYDHEAKCQARLKLFTAVFAIAINLSWLIAGTLWTTKLLKESNYGERLCTESRSQDQSNLNVTDFQNPVNSDFEEKFLVNSVENITEINLLNQTNANSYNRTHNNGTGNSNFFIVSDRANSKLHTECIECAKHVMFFSYACVVTDWIIFFFGMLYLSTFCCRKVIVLKDQLLIIKA